MDCPANERIHQFVEGELDAPLAFELHEHLEGCATCRQKEADARQALGTALSERSAPTTQEASAQKPKLDGPLAHGTLVGRYTVLDKLGSGGMAVVYSAYDPKLDRRVALKLLTTHRQRRSPTMQTRFLREAQAMALVSHPNVMAVHDVGTIGEDVFIAMEYVDGKDLKRWLKAEQRTWQEILDTMIAAGRGLAAAHAAGLVHRDVKPSNILVGHDGRVRVMDFGLVRNVEPRELDEDELQLERESALETSLTKTGAIMGTPQYMAPEQRRGASVDARADQFAFCVTLYKALFEQVPFDKSQQTKLALGRDVSPAEPPASRPVPAFLKRTIYRGLSRKPEDRYPTMDALLAALARHRGRRLRRGIAVGAGLMLALVASIAYPALRFQRRQLCGGAEAQLGGAWDRAREAEIAAAFRNAHQPDAAWERVRAALDGYAKAWVRARTDACEATLVRHEASDAVLAHRAGCLDRRLRDFTALSALLADGGDGIADKAVGIAESLAPVSTCLARLQGAPQSAAARAPGTGSLLLRLARARLLLRAGRSTEVAELAPGLLADARRGAEPSALAQALQLQGEAEALAGHLAEAGEALREAEWAAESVSDTESAAETAASLASLAVQQNNPDMARLWSEQARALGAATTNP